MTTTRTAATIGSSRTVHTMTSAGITLCSIDKSGNLVLIHPTDAAVTCRTCLGRMDDTVDTRVPARFLAEPAAYAENRRRNDHAEALMINTKVSAVVAVDLPLTTNQIAESLISSTEPTDEVEIEAKRLGYASIAGYLNAPGRNPNVCPHGYRIETSICPVTDCIANTPGPRIGDTGPVLDCGPRFRQ